MLLTRDTLLGIQRGAITLAFRRWRRPTVKAGGTLLTPIGQLAIEAVDIVSPNAITAADARAAGFSDLISLRAELAKRSGGTVYRVRLSLVGPDPRIALREAIPEGGEIEALLRRLDRLDGRAGVEPWTRRVLEIVRTKPGENSAVLASSLGFERAELKARVRRLKALGLTESLRVGYRLSPRGDAVLRALERK